MSLRGGTTRQSKGSPTGREVIQKNEVICSMLIWIAKALIRKLLLEEQVGTLCRSPGEDKQDHCQGYGHSVF